MRRLCSFGIVGLLVMGVSLVISGCAKSDRRPSGALSAGAPAGAPTRDDRARDAVPVAAPEGHETVNARVNPADGTKEDETWIAVNPVNPSNLVAAARATLSSGGVAAHYASFDGGLTWDGGPFPDDVYGFETDPVVTFCADGAAVFALLAVDTTFGPGGVFSHASLDGGMTWTIDGTIFDSPTGNPFPDKPWIVCDTTGSAFSNRVYAEWMEIDDATLGRQRIRVAWSDNHGETWSRGTTVSDAEARQNQGGLAIGPNGEVYAVWNKIVDGSLLLTIDRSTNGGVTWGTDSTVAIAQPIPQDSGVIRATYPSIDVDRSNGPHRGTVYVAWADQRNGDPDILVARSTNGGRTWQGPVRANDDPLGNGADQYHQAIAVDPKGRVIVAFWDRRRHIGDSLYEVWIAISRTGGRTFDTNVVVTDLPSDRALANFFGDYTGVAANADWIWPLWVDTRSGIFQGSDIYTDRYPNGFDYDEVRGVRWETPSTMTFEAQDEAFAQDLSYDVVSGLLSELHADAGFERAVCDAPLWDGPPYADIRVPPPGDGRYYLVRVQGADGVGTYGDGSPPKRINVRDGLDESLAVCP